MNGLRNLCCRNLFLFTRHAPAQGDRLLIALNLKLVSTPTRKWAGWNFAASIPYLLGLFVALKSVAYWLDRYGLVYSDRGEVFTGASYTDVNALLTPKTILVWVAALCALALLDGAPVPTCWLLPPSAIQTASPSCGSTAMVRSSDAGIHRPDAPIVAMRSRAAGEQAASHRPPSLANTFCGAK